MMKGKSKKKNKKKTDDLLRVKKVYDKKKSDKGKKKDDVEIKYNKSDDKDKKKKKVNEKKVVSKLSIDKTKVFISFLLLLFFVTAVMSISMKSRTTDEVVYAPAGYNYLKYNDFRMNPEHPPLSKEIMAIPLLFFDINDTTANENWNEADQWGFGKLFFDTYNTNINVLFFARLSIIFISILLGIFVFKWAKELYGDKAGIFALFLYVFSPNILAHSRLATTDLCAACFIFIAVYYFWKFLNHQTKKNLLLSGITLGLALVAKYTAIILIFIYIIISLFWIIKKDVKAPIKILENIKIQNKDVKKTFLLIVTLATIFFVSLTIINSSYFFKGSLTPFNEFRFESPIFSTLLSNGLISWMPSPVPYAYLDGLDIAKAHTERGHSAFLMGEYSEDGWWYYFIVTFLIKTPIPMLLFILFSFCFLAIKFIKKQKIDMINICFLLIPIFFIFTAFGILNNINIGLRYILPIYPFLFVFVSSLVNKINFKEKRKIIYSSIIILLSVWYIFSSVSIYPHYLEYFNEFTGGPKNGYLYLADSNLDWGEQDKKFVEEYINESNYSFIKEHQCAIPQKGLIQINTFKLNDVLNEGLCFKWLKKYKPIYYITPSQLIFNVTEEMEKKSFDEQSWLFLNNWSVTDRFSSTKEDINKFNIDFLNKTNIWNRYNETTPDQYLSSVVLFDSSNYTDNYTCNYAVTYLFSDETKPNIQLKTGSLGHTTIWINDEKIKQIKHSELKLDDNNINIQLKYGQNKLLVKSCGINSSKHGFFTRLTNEKNIPLFDILTVNEEIKEEYETIKNPANVSFNNTILFLGHDINKNNFKLTEKINISYYWKSLNKTENDYKIFVHFRNEKYKGFGADHEPVHGLYPISEWKSGEIIKETYTKTIPGNIKPGNYTIAIGWYNQNERLPIIKDGKKTGNSVVIGYIYIQQSNTAKIVHKFLEILVLILCLYFIVILIKIMQTKSSYLKDIEKQSSQIENKIKQTKIVKSINSQYCKFKQTRIGFFVKKYYAQIFLFSLILFHTIINWIWLVKDTVPPRWDQSGHLIESLKIYDIFTHPSLDIFQRLAEVSNYYPPFFQMCTTPLYALFGKSADVAVMTNILFLAILLFSVYGIGKKLYDQNTGILAAFFISFYPAVYSMTRTYLLDFALIAMVALSIFLLLKTDDFTNTKYSIFFGISLGLGLLTKWSFAFFIGPAILFIIVCILIKSIDIEKMRLNIKSYLITSFKILFNSKRTKNILVLSLIGLLIMSFWYIPNFTSFTQKLTKYSDYGVIEGDAELYSFESNTFYLFYLINFQTTFLAFIVFLVGLYLYIKKKDKFLLLNIFCILIPLLIFTFISNKDGRYTMPIIIYFALISAIGFIKQNNKILISFIVGVIFIFGMFQFIHAGFGISEIPKEKVIKFPYNQHIKLYSDQTAETSRPLQEDWKNEKIIEYITNFENRTENLNIGIVPNNQYFSTNLFIYYIDLKNNTIDIWWLNNEEYFLDKYKMDYVITKTGNIGPTFTTQYRDIINQDIHNKNSDFNKYFYLFKTYKLPDNSIAEIYKRKETISGALDGTLKIQNPLKINFNNQIEFLGYDLNKTINKNRFKITYYWKSLKPVNESYKIFVHFLNESGDVIFQQDHMPFYGLYNTNEWNVGEIIKETYNIGVWDNVKPNQYYISAGLYKGKKRLPIVIENYELLNQTIDIQNKDSINYNNTFEFLGYDLNKTQIEQDNKFEITYYWKSLKETEKDYTIFVHFVNETGKTSFQNDHNPPVPTSNWTIGQILKETQTVNVPKDVDIGNYSLFLGAYIPDEGRLPITKQKTEIDKSLDKIRITNPNITYMIFGNYNNKISFLGYDINKNTVERSDSFKITYFWKSLDNVDNNYTVFVHFIDENNKLIFQQDHEPAYGIYPTSAWNPGDIIKEEYDVMLPTSVVEGTYNIKIGLYNKETKKRIDLTDGSNSQIIGNITVEKSEDYIFEIIPKTEYSKPKVTLDDPGIIGTIEVK